MVVSQREVTRGRGSKEHPTGGVRSGKRKEGAEEGRREDGEGREEEAAGAGGGKEGRASPAGGR